MITFSNMPAIKTKKLKSGMNRTNFEKTSLMSSYLLALVVGEFVYLEKKTKNKVFRFFCFFFFVFLFIYFFIFFIFFFFFSFLSFFFLFFSFLFSFFLFLSFFS